MIHHLYQYGGKKETYVFKDVIVSFNLLFNIVFPLDKIFYIIHRHFGLQRTAFCCHTQKYVQSFETSDPLLHMRT